MHPRPEDLITQEEKQSGLLMELSYWDSKQEQ